MANKKANVPSAKPAASAKKTAAPASEPAAEAGSKPDQAAAPAKPAAKPQLPQRPVPPHQQFVGKGMKPQHMAKARIMRHQGR